MIGLKVKRAENELINIQSELDRRGLIPGSLSRVLDMGSADLMAYVRVHKEVPELFIKAPVAPPQYGDKAFVEMFVNEPVSAQTFMARCELESFPVEGVRSLYAEMGIDIKINPHEVYKAFRDNDVSKKAQTFILNQKPDTLFMEELWKICAYPGTVSDAVDVVLVASAISGNRVKSLVPHLQENKGTLIALTGGRPRIIYGKPVTEFEMQMIALLREGIFPQRVIGEDRSFFTADNVLKVMAAVAAVRAVKGRRLVLAAATSGYHSRRFYRDVRSELAQYIGLDIRTMILKTPYGPKDYWIDDPAVNRVGKNGVWFVLEEIRKNLLDLATRRVRKSSN